MKNPATLFDVPDAELALMEVDMHRPETTLLDLVAAVSDASRNQAEMLATLNSLLEDHDFWYEGEETDFLLN